jgi:hypothetical protein
MPRLHKYRERNACYVLTAIRRAIVIRLMSNIDAVIEKHGGWPLK